VRRSPKSNSGSLKAESGESPHPPIGRQRRIDVVAPAPPGHHVERLDEALQKIVRAIRGRFGKRIKISVRADSCFCRDALMS
jgi:hypothetical protein